MATTFAAISRDPEALRETISESPPTLQAATESFRVQTPFLARFAAVSRDLQPGTALLPTTLPLVNAALKAGVPAFRETPALGEDLEDLFRAAEDLGDNPNTLLALKDLRKALQVTKPALQFVAPVPDGLQRLRLLLQPARHAPVRGGARRHGRADPRQARRHPAGELARLDRVEEAGGHPEWPGSAGGAGQAGAPHAVRRPRRRLAGARGLPGRPDRISVPARCRTRATRAATSWSTRTRPGWPAAPTSRGSLGSRA